MNIKDILEEREHKKQMLVETELDKLYDALDEAKLELSARISRLENLSIDEPMDIKDAYMLEVTAQYKRINGILIKIKNYK